MKIQLTLSLVFVLAAGLSTSGQTNGSFEGAACNFGFASLPAGSNAIPDWTIGGGGVDWICNLWQASDGVRSIDLNMGSPGFISQEFDTTAGLVYSVSFDMSGNPDGGPDEKVLAVTADGSSAQQFTYDTAVEGNTRADMQWVTNTYTFTAADDSTLLSFRSLIPGPFGPALDNVGTAVVIGAQVCHRNNGSRGSRTLNIGADALEAHLAHGDTPGPCPAPAPRGSK